MHDWKSANVRALFKIVSRDNPSNYRLISLTCISCKLMEKLVRDNIINYITLKKAVFRCTVRSQITTFVCFTVIRCNGNMDRLER